MLWRSVAAIGLLVAGATYVAARLPAEDQAGATVKVILAGTHCSGVHLGGGLVLTAQHCTEMGVKGIKTDRGVELDAESLWANRDYDVALVTTHAPLPAAAASLSCRLVGKDEPITVAGNPMMLEWIETKGTVLSGLLTHGFPVGFGTMAWRESVVLDVTAAGGNSGGPVYDAHGKIVGILVGKFGQSAHSIMVPSATICRLLGRA